MKNLEFLKTIPNNFIIWWSEGIKKQISWFRKSNDLDIMIDIKLFNYCKFLLKGNIIEENKTEYDIEIVSVIFDDNSKIDFIINNELDFWKTKLLDWFYYLWIEEIMNYKVNLLFNDLNQNLNNKNKHLIDILYLYKNGYNLLKNSLNNINYSSFLKENWLNLMETTPVITYTEDIPF